jgi:hypothetical protein
MKTFLRFIFVGFILGGFYTCNKENSSIDEENLPIVKPVLPQISLTQKLWLYNKTVLNYSI